MPTQVVSDWSICLGVMPWAAKLLRKTVRIRSGLKKPIPQRPTTPLKASSMPTIVLRRHRGSKNSSERLPSFGPSPTSSVPSAARAATAFQRSGSFSRLRMTMASRAGRAPTTNIARHALPIAPLLSSLPRKMFRTAAVMLPRDESIWTQPRARGRARSGMASATRAMPTANSPPTPRPVRNR